jgi:hypothetical protein
VSSTISTPTAVASSAARFQGIAWRAVEAQHQVSTLALVDTLEQQAQLEQLLEESKPAVPIDATGFHWLLFTPFRYNPLRTGSRFRSQADPGVFYGADDIRTACAELGYWRWRFLLESPELEQIESKPQTVFATTIDARAVDLRRSPFDANKHVWSNPNDYGGCQNFAAIARTAGLQAIRYASVRDPDAGTCTAVLSIQAFASKAPQELQTWFLAVTRKRVFWIRDFVTRQSLEFDTAMWSEQLANT